jgi:hypothetical protein
VGEPLGTSDGAADGNCVGESVGLSDGEADVNCVGESVGLSDGPELGTAVGDRVGHAHASSSLTEYALPVPELHRELPAEARIFKLPSACIMQYRQSSLSDPESVYTMLPFVSSKNNLQSPASPSLASTADVPSVPVAHTGTPQHVYTTKLPSDCMIRK